MRLLERWLRELSPTQRVLDLGCGAGSLRTHSAGLNVIGVDIDPKELARNRDLPATCAESHRLPFAHGTFDLVVCHHAMEHFRNAPAAIHEIRRVLTADGRVYVSVPDGSSFSDRLYRLLLCGGGHFQRFTFESVVGAVESGTGLHLAASRELFSSFIFVHKLNFVPAPRGRLPGPMPRRMRWLGRLPHWFFDSSRWLLNVATRIVDRCFSTALSRYGWALAFSPGTQSPQAEPACWNVCMTCGAGMDEAPATSIAGLLYRCPDCSSLNPRFSDKRRASLR
jgi:SAM-dependent methyltransferase/DNA-directed RNA polymerase subunit RPC12/RpoP